MASPPRHQPADAGAEVGLWIRNWGYEFNTYTEIPLSNNYIYNFMERAMWSTYSNC